MTADPGKNGFRKYIYQLERSIQQSIGNNDIEPKHRYKIDHAQPTRSVYVIRWVSGRLNACTVIVEHDMIFVRELADRIFVLHQGRLLASGTVAEIQADERVRAVYVGASA